MITFATAAKKGLRFWDAANSGEECMVPCWPVDEKGDAVDCEDEAVLTGVLGVDGLFRAEDEVAFDPARVIWTCGRHQQPRLQSVGV
jgi:hypothetical protein